MGLKRKAGSWGTTHNFHSEVPAQICQIVLNRDIISKNDLGAICT